MIYNYLTNIEQLTEEQINLGFESIIQHKQAFVKIYNIIEFLALYLKWLSSYLENRTQMACINGSVSDLPPPPPPRVVNDVPQSSILGPRLLIIYMHDLPNCLTHCITNMTADDTTICVSAQNKAEVSKLLQEDLSRVNEWLCANKLSLHVGNTCYMLLTTAQHRRHITPDLTLYYHWAIVI